MVTYNMSLFLDAHEKVRGFFDASAGDEKDSAGSICLKAIQNSWGNLRMRTIIES
jgi:hypothetical protein